MAWITVPGLAGKVYVPEGIDGCPKKHPCKTCFSCQWCDETRCRVCRDNPDAAIETASAKGCACGRRRSLIDPSKVPSE